MTTKRTTTSEHHATTNQHVGHTPPSTRVHRFSFSAVVAASASWLPKPGVTLLPKLDGSFHCLAGVVQLVWGWRRRGIRGTRHCGGSSRRRGRIRGIRHCGGSSRRRGRGVRIELIQSCGVAKCGSRRIAQVSVSKRIDQASVVGRCSRHARAMRAPRPRFSRGGCGCLQLRQLHQGVEV